MNSSSVPKTVQPKCREVLRSGTYPYHCVKEFEHILVPPLTNIFNSCLTEGLSPSEWKSADVCPDPRKPRLLI
jgi:hypothetical protein